jgi:L-lysine exporter family protein LysE/ArgO
MLHHLLAIFSGAVFTLAVIAGIGPQSLLLISHGIKRNHPIAVATTCFLADISLILLACIGLSISDSHYIFLIINILGIIFISWYLYTKIKNLFKKREKISIQSDILTRKQAILRGIALTWLNPIVIIDTIVVIGGTATQYSGINRIDFTIGALLGDFVWTYALIYLAIIFSHKLNRVAIWLILDTFTILIMCFIWYKTLLFII